MAECENEEEAKLYLWLFGQLHEDDLDRLKDYCRASRVIEPAYLESSASFTDLCEHLKRREKIFPNDHQFLMNMFETIGRLDLRTVVKSFDRDKNRRPGPSVPVTCLYNLDVNLPIEERLHEFRGVLEKYLQEPRDVIPQQLFYINAAAGIARPDRDLSLELGKEAVVSFPKGAVTEAKIMYCHFVEGMEPCLLEGGQPLVCYAIPIFLGPPGEEFNASSPVILDINHNAAPARHTTQLKFFVKSEGDEPTWKEGEDHFCEIRKDGRATIFLRHFSEFVLGIDPSTITPLPPLRARLITSVRHISDSSRGLITCLAFDATYMQKKAEKIMSDKMGHDVSRKEIFLDPTAFCEIEIKASRWKAEEEIQVVSPDELNTLVFKPIIRETTLVPEGDGASEMCEVIIKQNTKSQEFFILEESWELKKKDEMAKSTAAAASLPDVSAPIDPYNSEIRQQRSDLLQLVRDMQEAHRMERRDTAEKNEQQFLTLRSEIDQLKDEINKDSRQHCEQKDHSEIVATVEKCRKDIRALKHYQQYPTRPTAHVQAAASRHQINERDVPVTSVDSGTCSPPSGQLSDETDHETVAAIDKCRKTIADMRMQHKDEEVEKYKTKLAILESDYKNKKRSYGKKRLSNIHTAAEYEKDKWELSSDYETMEQSLESLYLESYYQPNYNIRDISDGKQKESRSWQRFFSPRSKKGKEKKTGRSRPKSTVEPRSATILVTRPPRRHDHFTHCPE